MMEIPNDTLFVLGAGASVPYGLPTGDGLRRLVTNIGAADAIGATIRAVCNQTDDHGPLNAFQSDLAASEGTIDEFVKDRNQFSDIAKASIAAQLMTMEDDAQLLPARGGRISKRDWLAVLLNAIFADGRDRLNRLAFITFNFDDVLERRLYFALRARYGLEAGTAAELVRNMLILHLAGTLRELSTDYFTRQQPHSPRSTESFETAVRTAMNRIQFVHEPRAQDEIDVARFLVLGAKLIVILGFGFNPTNLAALQLDSADAATPIVASGFAMTPAEARGIEMRLERRIRVFEGADAVSLLRSLPNLHGMNDHRPNGTWE